MTIPSSSMTLTDERLEELLAWASYHDGDRLERVEMGDLSSILAELQQRRAASATSMPAAPGGWRTDEQFGTAEYSDGAPLNEFDPAASAHPEAACSECKNANPVWSAPSELWNEVMGGPDGIVCPTCFAARAEAMGIRPVWSFAPLAETAPDVVGLTLSQIADWAEREAGEWKREAGRLALRGFADKLRAAPNAARQPVQVDEEMVEAALQVWFDQGVVAERSHPKHSIAMRAALTAALVPSYRERALP